jgi:hypothetical protein
VKRFWAELAPDERPGADNVAWALVQAARAFDEAGDLEQVLRFEDLRRLSMRARQLAGFALKEIYPDLRGSTIARLCGLTPSLLAPSAFHDKRAHPVRARFDAAVDAYLERFR